MGWVEAANTQHKQTALLHLLAVTHLAAEGYPTIQGGRVLWVVPVEAQGLVTAEHHKTAGMVAMETQAGQEVQVLFPVAAAGQVALQVVQVLLVVFVSGLGKGKS